ncbi:MAG TPA: DNA polymerase I [Paracoccaceae bacterium]|nr:DNA polymerase I [Paracoccaceae bacterium]
MAGIGKGDHLHLIDGSGYIFRAYHALPPLTRKSDGLPVGAVAGFCNMLYKLVEDAKGPDAPTHVAVIFDYSSKTFRNELYPGYKAQRPEPPEDLRPQFGLIREATRAFNLPCIEMEGFEADDLIATYASQAAAAGARVTIVSSDKDLMQLVTDGIGMLDPMKTRRVTRDEVIEKFGVGPERVIDVQSLAGDSIDNVPGAPGIGLKTAALLINEYGDLDTLLARASEIKQPKRREALVANADQIRLSRELVTLKRDVSVPEPIEALALRESDPQKLLDFLATMEFRTLTQRIAAKLGIEPPAIRDTPREEPSEPAPAAAPAPGPIDRSAYETVRDRAALRRWIEAARERGEIAVDTETTSLDEMQAEIVGVSLATAQGRACYIPLGHVDGAGDLLGPAKRAEGQMDRAEAFALLKEILEDDSILKIGQNLKYDMKVFARAGIRLAPIDDTMLVSYALESGLTGHGMDTLSERHLGHVPMPIKELIGSGKGAITFARVKITEATAYAAEDADVTFRLHRVLKPRLVRDRLTTVYETLERPLVPVLAEMEMHGVKIDRDRLAGLSSRFAQSMARLEEEIRTLAGERFNIGSPKQLGDILFGRMGLPGGDRTKTGAWATPAGVLEQLAAEGHELPARVLDWRQLSKLKSTYTDALPSYVNEETGRVHTSFSLAATTTGRLASTDPNLQNIPVRTEEGRQIREAFIAEPGNLLLSLDYSQIELRILAEVADIPALKKAFRDGLDIHAMTASEMFNVPIEGMDPMIRRRAKAINFGVIYGISAFGLSNNLRIPRDEAQAFIDRYFEKFPGIRAYMDRTIAGAKQKGYVETLFGRRIHTPEINAKGPGAGFARRAAINAPIQGAAADVIRRAMIRVPPALAKARLPVRMILQVHDELLFEVPEAAADEAASVIAKVMANAPHPAVKLDVPLVVDAGKGPTWAAAH